ncbi:MAG: hypothetical protein C4519_17865 [Desulfobacteraceae bacterium]|nr:MAG: hypothetical protein C4519_17865 [Desulfobacteraceae bacterium]
MFALIYDTYDLEQPEKRVISVHKIRATAEKALEKRKRKLGKTTPECYTRIVWVDRKIKRGDMVAGKDFDTWKPGETIPWGETHSDTD